AALADLARRFERNGASFRPVHQHRCKAARELGDREQVLAALVQWQKARPDRLSDCRACDRNSLVSTYIFLGQDRRALRSAQPILNGKYACAHVPYVTYAHVLLPLARLGRFDEAAEYHRLGLPLIKNNAAFLESMAQHMIYMALVQDLAGAVKLF